MKQGSGCIHGRFTEIADCRCLGVAFAIALRVFASDRLSHVGLGCR